MPNQILNFTQSLSLEKITLFFYEKVLNGYVYLTSDFTKGLNLYNFRGLDVK